MEKKSNHQLSSTCSSVSYEAFALSPPCPPGDTEGPLKAAAARGKAASLRAWNDLETCVCVCVCVCV